MWQVDEMTNLNQLNKINVKVCSAIPRSGLGGNPPDLNFVYFLDSEIYPHWFWLTGDIKLNQYLRFCVHIQHAYKIKY